MTNSVRSRRVSPCSEGHPNLISRSASSIEPPFSVLTLISRLNLLVVQRSNWVQVGREIVCHLVCHLVAGTEIYRRTFRQKYLCILQMKP